MTVTVHQHPASLGFLKDHKSLRSLCIHDPAADNCFRAIPTPHRRPPSTQEKKHFNRIWRAGRKDRTHLFLLPSGLSSVWMLAASFQGAREGYVLSLKFSPVPVPEPRMSWKLMQKLSQDEHFTSWDKPMRRKISAPSGAVTASCGGCKEGKGHARRKSFARFVSSHFTNLCNVSSPPPPLTVSKPGKSKWSGPRLHRYLTVL